MSKTQFAFARMTALVAVWAQVNSGIAAQVVMKDGRIYEGKVAPIAQLAPDPVKATGSGPTNIKSILVIDDDLRRIYISKYNIANVDEGNGTGPKERVNIPQNVNVVGGRVGAVGPLINIQQWDQWGHRRIIMANNNGNLQIVQGITEITPYWTKVEAMQPALGLGAGVIWDMRIATSSIPRNELQAILKQAIAGKAPDKAEEAQKKLVRLFLWAGRYAEAEAEWKKLVAMAKNPAAYDDLGKELKRLSTDMVLKELEQRSEVGQHAFARTMYDAFAKSRAADPDIPGHVLEKVAATLAEYNAKYQKGVEACEVIDAQLKLVEDSQIRKEMEPLLQQVKDELNYNTLERMSPLVRLKDAPTLKPEQKLSLAISGWVRGSNAASESVANALKDIKVRELIRQYLTATTQIKRNDVYSQLVSLAVTPETVAQIADYMKPPFDIPADRAAPGDVYGYYELTVPGIEGQPAVTYQVQLPPEYDPYRRYPCIVTLNGSNTSPAQQIDWWAGVPMEKGDPKIGRQRAGQALRQGYVVIAPTWTKEKQTMYEASAAEHHAVLASLRDACRRFSIDTDRVYLTGHSVGGNAAWDIGLAHPDLWAGVIPIVAVLDESSFVTKNADNARGLPLYFVSGELDGDKTRRNAIHLDRYLTWPGNDCTIVEFQGRGHEEFSDEIQKLFDWMKRKQRNFFPKDFKVKAQRPWDNFFWWIEVKQFPAGLTVEPVEGARPKDKLAKPALELTSQVLPKRDIVNIGTTAVSAKLTIWLSPEIVDLSEMAYLTMNGTRIRVDNQKSVITILEDIRTRGDRHHPFWVKIEQPEACTAQPAGKKRGAGKLAGSPHGR